MDWGLIFALMTSVMLLSMIIYVRRQTKRLKKIKKRDEEYWAWMKQRGL